MNKKHFSILALLAVCAVAYLGIQSTQNARSESTIAFEAGSESPIYKLDLNATDDRLFATNNDTTTVPTLLYSLWSYNYTCDVTMEDDTASFVVILQESNEGTGSQWYELERDSVASLTGSTTVRLYGTDAGRSMVEPAFVRGQRQRIIFDIIAGTADTLSYDLDVTMKKY
jgi:hypothetical protein